MWCYVRGAKQVAETKTLLEVLRWDVKRQFFNEKWKRRDNGDLHDWLTFDESSQSMFRSNCRQHTPSSSKTDRFIVSTKYSELEAIRDLGLSKGHKEVNCIIQMFHKKEK